MNTEVKNILLAEDDPKDVELILEALGEHNLANKVVVTHDGEEAMDYLLRRGRFGSRPHGNPVFVLLDLKMPKVNGLEALRQMKTDEQLRTIPVVVLTSSREAPDLAEAYKLGVNAYVVKPVNFQDFIKAVRELGVFWAAVNEPPPNSNSLEKGSLTSKVAD